MSIAIVGTGYVGLVTGAVFADFGNQVCCIDIDENKILQLQNASIPFYEPGLEELVKRNYNQGRLTFTTDYKDAIYDSKIIFICVGTPPGKNGEADLSFVYRAVEGAAKYIGPSTLIVLKSTVPIGIEEDLQRIVKAQTKHKYEFASCPEFLREGSAIDDFKNPDRIIIGTQSKKAAQTMLDIFKPFNGQRVVCGLRSAQMIKYASNTLLATKISFANFIAQLCERTGANAETVLEGVGLDKRIGRKFLYPGVGFGGSCFPKDLLALIDIAKKNQVDPGLLTEVEKINNHQIQIFVDKVTKAVGKQKKTLGVLGLAFKPNTDDIREAPALKIINKLTKMGAKIRAYDPVAIERAKIALDNKVIYCANPYEAAKGSDALLIMTEWNEFKELDLGKIKKNLNKPIIVDGRNIYDPKKMKKMGFTYISVGRPPT